MVYSIVHLQCQYNITWAIITSEWPIWWHHMVGHEGCSSFAELSHNKILKATQYSHIGLYSVDRSTFFNVTVYPIVLSFETWDKCNLAAQILKNKQATPFGTTVSVKIVGTLCCLLALPLLVCKIWWVTCDKQHWKDEETGQKQKNRVKVSQLFFVWDCSSPLSTEKN